MSIQILPNTKIFVACPANVVTGGPEILHQLGFHLLNDLNIKVFMYYYQFDNNKFETPVDDEYKFYNLPYVATITDIDDTKTNILIVPEILSSLILLSNYKNIRKVVWFLSVDNYYVSKITKKDFFFQKVVNKIMKIFNKSPVFNNYIHLEKLATKYDYRNDNLLEIADFYMMNSYRGLQYFKDLNPLYYIQDNYISPKFFKMSLEFDKKENIVAYNPKKGLIFTKKIISFAKDVKFIPLVNMSREEVVLALQKAKVYIDFGHFPGPERVPKEALFCKCCVITGKKGSAAYYEDVPIQEIYKFEDRDSNIPKIIETIKKCFEDYESRSKDFNLGREIVINGPKKFIEDLKNIFEIKQ